MFKDVWVGTQVQWRWRLLEGVSDGKAVGPGPDLAAKSGTRKVLSAGGYDCEGRKGRKGAPLLPNMEGGGMAARLPASVGRGGVEEGI